MRNEGTRSGDQWVHPLTASEGHPGAIDQVLGLADTPAVAAGQPIEGQTMRIYDFFCGTDTLALYLVVHIDAPAHLPRCVGR